jgi:hypothetical protein
MTRKATPEDYMILHLTDGATADEAKRAYHKMKALYSESSLATYSLMEDEQRTEVLHKIEMAYMHISQDLREEAVAATPTLPFDSSDQAAAPGPSDRIGPYLRQRRESLGYTINDVARRTRVRSTYLEQIENEQFKDLPATVYLRGFVLEYARLLGLPDPEKITRRFLDQAGSGEL